MKNRLKGMAALATFILVSSINTNTYAQKVEKGTFAIDAYYGFPNILTNIIRTVYSEDGSYKTYHVSGFGPAGIRAEYFVTDHIAFGTDINYSLSTVTWTREESVYDNNSGNYYPQIYDYKVSVPRLRILGKFNFHFGASEHFDWYAGGGLGYNHATLLFTSNDPSYEDREHIGNIFLIPISGRIDFGGKFYFTKNIGVGFEVGLGGGPLASLGICAKF